MRSVDRNKTIEVMIVDDSAIVRSVLTEVLASDPRINVMAVAQDPIIALNKMEKQTPDVIILDIEMPRMDGLTFLRKVMQEHPIPILICSSLTEAGADTTLKAMQYGAVDIIHKPKVGAKQFLEESKVLLTDAVKAASIARIRPIGGRVEVQAKLTADAVLSHRVSAEMIKTTEKVVVVGASTGGTEALRIFLEALPHDSPGMVIVQHMPAGFTAAFAKRLNEGCKVTVKEAVNNDTVVPGRVLISPGNFHTLLKRSGARYYVEVKDGPLVCRHRPSVDVLFRSTARYAGQNAVGVIMTGMGDDGSKGLLEMKEAGAATVAQDEKSCIVFGMPKEAIKLNCVDHIVPLEKIASTVLRKCL